MLAAADIYLLAIRSLAASSAPFVTDISAINGPQDRRYLAALIEAWERTCDERRHEAARLAAENQTLATALFDALEELRRVKSHGTRQAIPLIRAVR